MTTHGTQVEKTFLRSLTLCVSLASLVLARADETWYPAGLTPLVAVIAWYVVDTRHWLRLTVPVANALGILAFVAMAIEFFGNSLLGKLLSGAHLLVYITWVVLFLQKGFRQFWWLAALCILQLAVASVLVSDGEFGLSVVVLLLLLLWTLSVFTLYRGQVRASRSDDVVADSLNPGMNREDSLNPESATSATIIVRNGLQVDTNETWISWKLRGMVGFAFVSSLFVGAIAFLVFPRVQVEGSPLAELASSQIQSRGLSQTGFTDNVQLGEIGRIMQTEGRVLQFKIARVQDDAPVTPEAFADAMRLDEIIFRGNALGHYENRRWTPGSSQGQSFGDLSTNQRFVRNEGMADFRISIQQEPPIRTFAFSPTPVLNLRYRSRENAIHLRRLSSTLTWEELKDRDRALPKTYTVWIRKPPSGQRFHSPEVIDDRHDFPTEQLFDFRTSARVRFQQERYAHDWCITRNLDRDLPELCRLAEQVILPTDGSSTDSPTARQRADRIFHFLNTSGQFQYSLTAEVQEPAMDPVEDFVLNRKTGHCEYFASAFALMLQAVGVPARVINGYKGYDRNSVSGQLEVRQKHAHTWVEVWIDQHWETFDPTPAAARENAVTQSGSLDWLRDLSWSFNDLWRSMVENMSSQRQEALIAPVVTAVQAKLKEVREQGIWETLKKFWKEWVLHPEHWFSGQALIGTFVILLIPGLLMRQNLKRRWKDLLRAMRAWWNPQLRQQASVVRFYEHFCDVCRRHGLTLSDSQTAQEHAHAAVQRFNSVLLSPSDRQLPQRIATAFNQVRFGNSGLPQETIEQLRTDIQRLNDLLTHPEVPAFVN
ncbi:MAG: DUF3488 and transglutaminase-like domain-containing protein [Planctomycetaceae bacterium]